MTTNKPSPEFTSRVLRIDEVMQKTRLSRSSILTYRKKGDIPAPIYLTQRAIGWLESDIDTWLESREKARV